MKSIESSLLTLSVITFGHVALMAQAAAKKSPMIKASPDTIIFTTF